MTATFRGTTAASGRPRLLSFCMGALALACGLAGMPAMAQTSVDNIATIAPPDGLADPVPGNDSDNALISVMAPQPPFDSCDSTMYLSQNNPTQLFRFDTSSNPFQVAPIGADAGFQYNATAVSPLDNYQYAILTPTNSLVRIGGDGSVEELGAIAGMPSVAYNAGEIGPDGVYYVKPNGANTTLYRVDIATMTATLVTLSQSVNVSDMAWHNGLLYGHMHNDGVLYAIDPNTGATTAVGQSGIADAFGAMFGASNGVFGSLNTGGFYRFDLTTGAATLISDLQGSGNNDGAKCATTPLEFAADLAITKDDGSDTYVQGEDVVYSIVVSNLGPFGVAGATVDDPLPAGIANANWTCGGATGGGVCTVPSGTGAIADVPVNLPAGASVTLTMTLSVPADFSGDLVNTATVTSPPDSPDTNPANNTATDTDTAEPAVVTVAKTANPVPGTLVFTGQTITYTLTTTIAGGATSDVVTLTDTPSAGLSFAAVTDAGAYSCNATLPLVCTLPAGTAAGAYPLEYTMTVDSSATATVGNSVVPSGGDNPSCTSCTTQHLVQPNFGSCDATMYLAQNNPTGLFQFDTSSNPFVVNPVGPTSAIAYNAIAYSPVDNYIYGLRGPAPGTLVRVGSDGGVEDVGTIANFPTNSVIGEIGPDGTYYTATSTTLYRIDIETLTATPVALSQNISGQDMAWHNGLLYIAAPDAGPLYTVDPANGNVTQIGSTGVVGGFGGMFGASNGVFGSNNNGGFYRFDLTTGAATLISDLPGSGNNDGAKCATTPLDFPADLSITKDDGSDTYTRGGDTVYTIVVSNLGPFGVPGATVSDPLPAGITTANWTCGAASGGGVCGVASGSGAIQDVPVDLPANATVTFTLTMAVPADFTGELTNTATVTSPPDGSPDPTPGNNTASDTDTAAVIRVNKAVTPASGTPVSVGDTLAYMLTIDVEDAAIVVDEVLTDTLSDGLTPGPMPAGCTVAGQVITCILPGGSPVGTYTFAYTATVDADALASVSNSVVPSSGICETCTTTNPVDPTVLVNKSADPASGTAVSVGDTLTYTLTVDVANSATTADEVLTDTLGAGLTAGTLPAGCTAAGQVITCTLAAGAAIGTHSFVYTATVDADAETAVGNSVEPGSGACQTCTTTNPVDPTVTVNKTVDPASGMPVSVGDTLTYTLTVDVANAVTTADEVLTDTLGAGLTVGTLPAGCTAAGQVITCTLAAGAGIGTHSFVYTATVDGDAETAVGNSVEPGSGTCQTCTTTNPVDPTITVDKSVNPGSGTAVSVGDSLTYTLTVNVANATTTADEVLTDTLGAGLTVGTLPAGCTAAGQVITCTLPAGSAVGSYGFTYTATVDADAETTVSNSVEPGNGTCLTCTTTNPVDPTVTVNKTVDPASGTPVSVGDTLSYTLTVEVANAVTAADEVLTDTLGTGLTVGTLPAGCTAAGQVITCTLAAGAAIGTHSFVYTATVDADAVTAVSNNVEPGSGTCLTCTTTNPVDPTITVDKSVNPGSGTAVSVGDTLNYTLTVEVANAAIGEDEVLTDTLGTGLTVGTLPAGCTAAGQVITCTLPAGSAIGTHTFAYTATVDADAETAVGNSVEPGSGTCQTCTTTNPLNPTITVNKGVDPASGTAVAAGSTLTYTLTVDVANAATVADEVLTDTLGDGLTVGTPPAGCTAAGQVITCTLPAGSPIGSYDFVYTATVDADAETEVGNSVDPSSATCQTCTTTNPLTPSVTVNKSVDPASGTAVSVGSTLTYTLTVVVGNAVTADDEVLTDTLGDGLTVGTLPAGCTAAGQVITCTLAAGAAIGTHSFAYTATVDADATTAVSNSVTTSTGNCQTCTTTNPVVPRLTVSKSADPANGETVEANQLITYTVTAIVANAASSEALTLTDTLSEGQALVAGSIQVPAGGSCEPEANTLVCTLAAETAPGSYAFVYQARVDAGARVSIGNQVAAQGGGGEEPECTSCGTEHLIAEPVVDVVKSADPAGGAELFVGDALQYTLTVTVSRAAITSDVVLEDTPSAGLTFGELPTGCMAEGAGMRCTLPAGTVPGTYVFTYPATINADAGASVSNAVVARGGGGVDYAPVCLSCGVEHKVADAPQLRVIKASSVREAKVGDLVRYTLTVQNVGAVNVRGADVVDTPPAGFSYVDGSLSVVDGDNAATASGYSPIRFEGIDVDAGETATLMYLMRVGAGVRQGMQVNQAQAWSDGGRPISNIATAEVALVADPLVDDSLILGSVFDDRDGDGWQDGAALTGVRVQGGFDPAAYVPNSTTIDRGAGPQPLPDASAPLLHGIDVGDIGARQSEADPAERRQVVISQRLTRPDFTGDFVLTTKQGATLRMDAAGATSTTSEDEAADGLNTSAPAVERRVAQGEGGVVVDYVIRNDGIDERGIPGVRIASVDGLLVETDQFGRYHLAGIPGGAWERGRNFILKVDPSTLPPSTQITTDNPLVRRITPGLPVRFDFGAKLPAGTIEGGERQIELELGEVIFAPGSAEVRERYLPAIGGIADRIAGYGGGEVVIHANGESETLAFDRATAVKAALLSRLSPETAQALRVSVRTDVADPATLVAGIGEDGPLLGAVLFDTDRDTIRPEFAPLLERIAAHLEQAQGGIVSIVGHADRRGADAYNLGLGLRRARAVYDAIAAGLSPEVRARVRVETSEGPATPAGDGQ